MAAITPNPRRTYIAVQLTISALTSLHKALSAITEAQSPPSFTPSMIRELSIQADVSNGADVLIGDSFLTTTNYGTRLTPNATRNYRSGNADQVPVGGKYLLPVSGTVKVNVELELA